MEKRPKLFDNRRLEDNAAQENQKEFWQRNRVIFKDSSYCRHDEITSSGFRGQISNLSALVRISHLQMLPEKSTAFHRLPPKVADHCSWAQLKWNLQSAAVFFTTHVCPLCYPLNVCWSLSGRGQKTLFFSLVNQNTFINPPGKFCCKWRKLKFDAH